MIHHLVFASRADFERICLPEEGIGATPQIEGGGPPVLIAGCVELVDGRCVVAHPFDELTLAWIQAFTQGEKPAVEVWADVANVSEIGQPKQE